MDFTEIAVPILLSAVIGNWTRNITVEQDTVPPTVVSVRQIGGFTEGDVPMGQVLIEFSEPVFAVSSTLFCTASLSLLSSEYSALEMVRDSSRVCGQDLSSRSFDAAIRVTGAQSHHVHPIVSDGIPRVLLDVFPFPHTASTIGIFMQKGAVADYAGNLLQEDRQQFLRYEPTTVIPQKPRHKHEPQKPPEPFPEEPSSDLSPCRRTGTVFASLAAASMISAFLTSARSKNASTLSSMSICSLRQWGREGRSHECLLRDAGSSDSFCLPLSVRPTARMARSPCSLLQGVRPSIPVASVSPIAAMGRPRMHRKRMCSLTLAVNH